MEAVVGILALVFLLCVVIGVYATVKVAKAAKRRVDRTVTQARRTVEDTRLRAKQYTQPGAAGEIAELRISLRTSMRATRQALDAAAVEDSSLSESLSLFERLSTHGHEVDDDLRRLESEPDRSRIAARLPELRKRTERVTHSADSLRWAIQDRAGHFAEGDLADLGDQIQLEAAALRHWRAERAAKGAGPLTDDDWGADISGGPAGASGAGRESRAGGASGFVGTPGGGSAAGRASGPTPRPTSQSASASGSAAERAASGARPPGGAAAAETDATGTAVSGQGDAATTAGTGSKPTPEAEPDSSGPPSLTAGDPRLRKTYSWQRAARPENTT
ncbi:hypothetical protein [Streptomyces zagrosensis]|uniref:Secreted protein n=1 Tax=Streptomyces zagrosensis TaxID=1042984 RepID=A0A7W9Q3L5_9ACTN|nr:hypothetical protein [Streptomyces zagrosensis]